MIGVYRYQVQELCRVAGGRQPQMWFGCQSFKHRHEAKEHIKELRTHRVGKFRVAKRYQKQNP